MKYRPIIVGKVYRKKEPTDYRLTNGASGKSYKIIFDDYDSTEDTKITEDAYNAVNNGDCCIFECDYNSDSDRKELRITKVLAILKEDRLIEPLELARAYTNSVAKSEKTSAK